MVDAVFTWVDGSDPAHREKRLKYQGVAEFTANAREESTSETRFADAGEIWYSINLLRKNADWIDRIFLVTDQQRPSWLCEKRQKELNITLVDHTEIFSGYEEFLPTFNSRTIEMMLVRIPGISDQFIYLNDDIFVIRKIKYNDFFSGNRIRYRGKWQMRGRSMLGPLKKIISKEPYGLVGLNVGRHELPFSLRRFRLAHAPHPVMTKEMSRVLAESKMVENNIHFKFRNKQQQSPFNIFANMALSRGFAKKGPDDWDYLVPGGKPIEDVEKYLTEFKRNDRIKTVCIQSLDMAEPQVNARVIQFLERMLSD